MRDAIILALWVVFAVIGVVCTVCKLASQFL
jgi:hypothetical protein